MTKATKGDILFRGVRLSALLKLVQTLLAKNPDDPKIEFSLRLRKMSQAAEE